MATDLFVGLSGSLKPSFKSRCFGLAEGVVCCSLEERSHPDWKWPFTGLPLIGCIMASEGDRLLRQDGAYAERARMAEARPPTRGRVGRRDEKLIGLKR